MAWKIDLSHSQVTFSVRHMMISNAHGRFEKFDGEVNFNEADPTQSSVDITIDPASINTRDEKRDGHLRSPDFFDAEGYPEITFQSTSIRPVDEDTFEIEGDLTIRAITRPVTLKAVLEGAATDPQGNERVGLSVRGEINRSDHDMKFNVALGGGNMLVSDRVKILLDISAVKVD